MSVSPNQSFSENEINPLASPDQWEDSVLERYPTPGTPAKTMDDFRNYEDIIRDTVKEFYRLNHTYQNYLFVKEKKKNFDIFRITDYNSFFGVH